MVKKCARPGIDHFSSFVWPKTSLIWLSDPLRRDVVLAAALVADRLPRPDQLGQPQHALGGEDQHDRGGQQADDQPATTTVLHDACPPQS